ncbi:3-oxoacyl-[acyl-carrier protein] reductase [Alicyclobacillus sacchari]|uniref:3-oxoacyl-[acyl-carrier protein] reductase n=1 Tax=Alicyclobacillus sacchari TaxID=392010 RepID=A0A4R8LL46_9BACL|nr:SDR family oxidoreductase [Alicyclobacillus sacchari]TDY45293.1 3-oxoacyl-[acyl-carrier protein] reductase [Alicyclobacillus sacchari]GMA56917.1 3-oxoacyl-ACP reductase [Alicyclobacillus sacchari]
MPNRRVALVSDASHPFGVATAKRLAHDGMTVVLNGPPGPREQAVAALALVLQAEGHDALVTVNDMKDTAAVTSLCDDIVTKYGRIDLHVHTHNRIDRGAVASMPHGLVRDSLHFHAKTAFLCTQVIGQRMAAQGEGCIVYVGSIHGDKPTGSAFSYALAQGALQMLCKEAALELGRSGVRVNLIAMGPVEGDDMRFQSDISDIYLDYQYKVPSATLGTAEDVAEAVAWATSDGARYLNGAIIRLDGGFALHYMDHKMKR